MVWLNFTPHAGHEQAGIRPALILSPRLYNQKVGLAICCPITSRIKGYPFEVSVPPESPIQGVILADQVKNVDWKARKAVFKCKVFKRVTNDVLAKLATLLSRE